jgi:hypothetical protein
MIPDFTEEGLLPEGIHRASLVEFEARFAIFDKSDRRLRLFKQLEKLLAEAKRSTIVTRILVAGSYVTNTSEPNDFDCILVLDPSIIGREIEPYKYNLVSRRAARRIYRGDVVPVFAGSSAFEAYLAFFQTTSDGRRMGIVEIDL